MIHPEPKPRDRRRQVMSLIHALSRVRPSQRTALILIALLVGIGGGLAAVAFRWLIDAFSRLFFDEGRSALKFLGDYYVVVIPALGGLVVGPLIYFFAREAKGHGVPEVMEAVALRGGRIRPIVVLIKALASSVCIGSGGSVGREGPIVQIGSALGSTLGQWFKLSQQRIRALVACGAAAGIAATFNAPIAGVFFALEVILGQFTAAYFGTVVVSAVTAGAIAHAVYGNVPAFAVPSYSLQSVWEYPLYALLGVITAVVGTLFVVILYRCEDLFDRWRIPEYVKPVLGGVVLGGIGYFFPQVFGVGYGAIEEAFQGNLALETMAALIVVKIVATSLTIGSGGSGGVFAPSLFLGAMTGGTFGMVVNRFFPEVTGHPGGYALVGMAAVFGATARAPITSILILFEMTGDYKIILPLMLATVVGTFLADVLSKESIYTMKLSRRGVRITNGRDIDVMEGVQVESVMSVKMDTVSKRASLTDLAREFECTHRHSLPVLDDDGRLFAVVTVGDLEIALAGSSSIVAKLTVGEIATTDLTTITPVQSMATAVALMAPRDLNSLPVVSPEDPTELMGIIRRGDLGRAYDVGIMSRTEQRYRSKGTHQDLSNGNFLEFSVSESSSWVGETAQQCDLPGRCLIVSIRRDSVTLSPDDASEIRAGDLVTVFGGPSELATLRDLTSVDG